MHRNPPSHRDHYSGERYIRPRLPVPAAVRVRVLFALVADAISRCFNWSRILIFLVFCAAGVCSLKGMIPSADHTAILDVMAIWILARKAWCLLRIEFSR